MEYLSYPVGIRELFQWESLVGLARAINLY